MKCEHSVTTLTHSLEFYLRKYGNEGNLTIAHRPVTQARIERHVRLCVKYPLLLPDFNRNWEVSTNFSKTRQYKI